MSRGRELLSGPVVNALAAAARLGALFALGRLVAERLGGAGLLALGQWQNLLAIAVGLGGNALQSGFQQGMARRGNRSSWFCVGIFCGQFLTLAGCLAALALCGTGFLRLPSGATWPAPLWLLPVALLASLSVALQGSAAGIGRLGHLSGWLSLSGLLQLLCMAPFLGSLQGLAKGFLLATALQAAAALVLLPHPKLHLPSRARMAATLRAWLPWILAGLLPALLAPFQQLLLRQLALSHDAMQAGYWQGAVRLSDTLFPLWSAAATAWILPRLARDPSRQFLSHAVARSFLGAAALGLAVTVGASLALRLAYGAAFLPAAPYLRLQAAVEVIRALSLPFALSLMARGRLGIFLSLEAASTVLQLGLALFLIPHFGTLALPLAALLENLAYCLCAMWLVKADFRNS